MTFYRFSILPQALFEAVLVILSYVEDSKKGEIQNHS